MRLATAILTAALVFTADNFAPAQQGGRYPLPPPNPNGYGQGYYPPQRYYYPRPNYAPLQDSRHLWLYGSDGQFRQLSDGTWVEQNGSGAFGYQELGRTPAYVELYDPDRAVWVRLYDNQLFSRGEGGAWSPGHVGHWG